MIGLAAPAMAQGDATSGNATSGTGSGGSAGVGSIRGAGVGSAGLDGGVLPAYGTGTRVGGLRSQLEGLVGGAGSLLPAGVAWRIVPAIGVDVGVTDNARRISSPREADVFTEITPSILILGDTPRVSVSLSYSPLAQVYASTPGQNRLDHYLNAGAQVTIIPETFIVDARASVSQQSRTGGFGQAGFSNGTRSAFNRQDQVQSTTVQVTPSYVNRFGSLGTAQVLYSLSYTTQNDQSDRFGVRPLGSDFGASTSSATRVNLNGLDQGFSPQGSLITHQERATFTTGEDFGRIRTLALIEATQYDGPGSYRGAYRREISLDNAYAINRNVSVLGKVGYEQLRYTGQQGYRFSGITWNVGGRLTPNQDDYIELRYGERNGIQDFSGDASYSPTARIRLLARYNDGITSNAQDQQNLLSSTSVDAFGGSIDTATGAPVATGGGFFGTQNSVYQLRRLSLSAVYLLSRDTISLSLDREERTPVSQLPNGNSRNTGQAPNQFRGDTGTYGTINWEHDLANDWRTNVSLQVGTRSVGEGSNASERTLSASAGTSYQLSETLSSRATYVFNQRAGGGQDRGFTENLFIVGLRKSF